MNDFKNSIVKAYQEAMTLAQLAPWDFIQDQDVFAIEDPISKSLYFVNTQGQGESLKGLLISKGFDAYLQGQKWLHEGDKEIKANTLALYSLYFDHNPLADIEKARLNLAAINEPTPFGWPKFKDFTPEYLPWFPSDQDFEILRTILTQARIILSSAQREKGHLSTDYGCLVRKLVKGLWQEDFLAEMPEEHQRLAYMRPDNPQIIAALPQNNGASFEAVLELSDLPFQYNPQERPFYPWIFLLIDGADGRMLDYRLTSREENFVSISHSLVETLNKTGYRPKEIITAEPFTKLLLSELSQEMNINIVEGELQYGEKLCRLIKMRLKSSL